MADLVSYLGEYVSPGDSVILTIVRNDTAIELAVTICNRQPWWKLYLSVCKRSLFTLPDRGPFLKERPDSFSAVLAGVCTAETLMCLPEMYIRWPFQRAVSEFLDCF